MERSGQGFTHPAGRASRFSYRTVCGVPNKDSIWETIRPDEKEKYYKNASDGAFWMSFDDFLTEFEKLDICLLPDDRFLHLIMPALNLISARPTVIT